MNFLYRYGKYILACILLALLAVIGLILLRLTSGAEYSFATGITEISGNAVVRRNGSEIIAYTGMYIQTDDVVFTLDDSYVTMKLDKSKLITLEPNTSIYFTVPAGEGAADHVIVNLTAGAVFSEINSDDTETYIYEIKTPNSIIRTSDSIFRTVFTAHDNFDGKQGAYVTALECYSGDVVSQLYDNQGGPVEGAMKLLPRKSSELITTVTEAFYNYLNQDFDLNNVPGYAINRLIAASATNSLDYSLAELNDAVKRAEPLSVEAAVPVDNTTMSSVTEAPAEITSETTESVTETSEQTTKETSATTRQTTAQTTIHTTVQTTSMTTSKETTAATTASTTSSETAREIVTRVPEPQTETTTETAAPQISETTAAVPVITGGDGRVITSDDRWETSEVTRRSVSRRLITTAETTEPSNVYTPRTDSREIVV